MREAQGPRVSGVSGRETRGGAGAGALIPSGVGAGEVVGRQRVRALNGGYARRHGEARARARWAPGSSRSLATSSDASSGHGSHGGEVICGGELKATATS